MRLAEFEIWHSRPLAPTRRIALGHMSLPVDPAPGFGGVLLAAVVARHAPGVDDELRVDVQRLITEIDSGRLVPQPRLRHRYQVDRHGLTHSTHRMVRDGDSVDFVFETNGTDLQQVLGAVYALERLDAGIRSAIVPAVRRAFEWRGPIGNAFIASMAGTRSSDITAVADPRAWALDVLGFPGGTVRVSKREVMARYRESLRRAHPDHGGDDDTAHKEIIDITEARRVLLESM